MIAQEPVRLDVAATPAAVRVTVDAEAGALDARAGAIHVHARLTRGFCGGSFAFTPGVTVIDATPPQPTPGTPYRATAQGTPAVEAGTYNVCVYLDDDEGRQWATDTDSQVTVGASGPGGSGEPMGAPGCTRLTRSPRRITRGALIFRARTARKRGHVTLLLRTRMSTRVTVQVGRRTLHRRARPCKLVVVRLPGRHGRARLAVMIRRGSERRTLRY